MTTQTEARCTEQDAIDGLFAEYEHYAAIERYSADAHEAAEARAIVLSRTHSILARQRTQRTDWHKIDCAYHANGGTAGLDL